MRTKRLRLVVVAAMAFAILIAAPVTAHAMVLRQGQNVTIGAGETINDDVYAFGSNVSIEGTVNGDVIAAGQTVSISGHVSGSVFGAGQTVSISAPVGGSVRAAGQSVDLSGTTRGDALLAGSSVSVASETTVGRDVAIGASDVSVLGAVGRNLDVSASTAAIGGDVGGNARVQGQTIKVLPSAKIAGAFDYYSNSKPQIEGSVVGVTTGHPLKTGNVQRNGESAAGGLAAGIWLVVAWFQSLIGMGLFGLLALLVLPAFMRKSSDVIAARPWPTLGFGCLTMVVVPALALIVFLIGLLVGGWWIAFVLLGIYGLALLAAMIVGALAFGTLTIGRGHVTVHAIWLMLFGLAVIWVVGLVPIIGWLAGAAATLFGLGALLLTSWEAIRAQQTSRVQDSMRPTSASSVESQGSAMSGLNN